MPSDKAMEIARQIGGDCPHNTEQTKEQCDICVAEFIDLAINNERKRVFELVLEVIETPYGLVPGKVAVFLSRLIRKKREIDTEGPVT